MIYEYGAMSTKFSLIAENKLTAYVTMVTHYNRNAHLMVIYKPKKCVKDNWANITGQISARLDEIFGGEDSFDKYAEANANEIAICYKTIKKIVG